jgi:tripartite ATP-independent transporter DctM subunit
MILLATYALLFIALVAISVPIAFALGISTIAAFVANDYSIQLFAQRLWTGLDRFTLVAIPLFILTGELVGGSGILTRLMDFARMLVGRIKGGLFYINILVSMFFGGVNGSAIADTSAIGSMLIKATSDEYKDAETAAAVTACSSIVGPIIPPSIPMLIYAFAAANVSVAGMFLAGVVPGILLGLAFMAASFIIILGKPYPRGGKSITWPERLRIIRRFAVAVVLPVIMVVGIVGGIVTPTEAGCLGILYALVIGFFVTRELTMRAVYRALKRTVIVSAIVMIMVAVGNGSTWLLTIEGVPQLVSDSFRTLTGNPNVFLLLMLLFYVLVGMFIEQAAAMIMLVPVFAPLAGSYGIDPLHFGVFTCLSLAIGLVTPPVGLCLFVSSSIAQVSLHRVFRASVPYLMAMIAVLLLVTYAPQIYLWLPKLFGIQQ